jgi:hypothetical protein
VFTPGGELLHGDAAAEAELVYLVETPDGMTDLLTPAEFRRRTAMPK